MFTPELLSLIGGGVTGFIFRHMAEKRQADKEAFERLIQANTQTTQNQNQAVKRVPVDAGKITRRFIVLIVLFGTILAPFILPFFNIPTVVEVIQDKPEWFFGLIPASKEVLFKEINGYLFTQENRQILVSIIGFYFGSAAASNKT